MNVPNVKREEIRGVRITRQGKRVYTGAVVEKTDPRGEKYYWIGIDEPSFQRMQDSDIEAVLEEQCISITPLKMDLTDYDAIGRVKELGLRE